MQKLAFDFSILFYGQNLSDHFFIKRGEEKRRNKEKRNWEHKKIRGARVEKIFRSPKSVWHSHGFSFKKF